MTGVVRNIGDHSMDDIMSGFARPANDKCCSSYLAASQGMFEDEVVWASGRKTPKTRVSQMVPVGCMVANGDCNFRDALS